MKYIHILLLLSLVFSQNSDFVVSKIIVDGNIEISDQDIISLSGLNIKKSITAIDIQNAVKRLWLVGKFKDIQIDIDETYKGIDLYIRIEEHPKLNKVLLTGSYFDFQILKFKKSKSKLLDLLSIKEGDILTDQNIKNSIQILADDFSKRNFHNADISYELKKSKVSNTENLLIKINANKKSRIKDISLKLNGEEIKSSSLLIRFKNLILNKSNELDKNTLIKNLDKIKKWKWYLPWRGKYDDSKLNDMENNLILFFKSLGYLNFKIINYEVIDNKLTIDIETGNKFKVNNISFNGNYIFSDSTLQSNLKLVKGKTFNGKSYEISNLNLNTLYRDKGYLFAEIIPSLIPVGKDSINLNFTINEKSIAKVKKIIIKGNLKT